MGNTRLVGVQTALLLTLAIKGPILNAETLNVAVASNFARALESIARAFESSTEHEVRLIRGSSGKHYAQIRNGAPFDVFLSADELRPRRLVEEGIAIAGSERTYALGQLALWSSAPGLDLGEQYLVNSYNYQTIAMANPRLAPYGQAALEVLGSLGLSELSPGKRVLGENIAQTFQFAYSGNADLGFVAYAQTLTTNTRNSGSVWLIPKDMHQPIRQNMVLLTDSEATQEFFTFMQSSRVSQLLLEQGYLLPEAGS